MSGRPFALDARLAGTRPQPPQPKPNEGRPSAIMRSDVAHVLVTDAVHFDVCMKTKAINKPHTQCDAWHFDVDD